MQDSLGAPQSVLVLGGTSEIALAVTRQLVERRAKSVVLAVRNLAAAKPAAEQLAAAGAEVELASFDALDTGSHGALFEQAAKHLGDIDLVLIAFGTLGDQESFDADPMAAAEAARVNYVGAVSVGLVAADRVRRQGHGTIVVLSSVAAERARASNFVYGSSKAGLDAFAQGLGDSLAGTGGRVVIVRPGFVKGRMTAGLDPQPFATTPDEVAVAIVAGLERNREIIWVPGLLRYVFAIMRHLPRPVWRVVSAR